MFCPPFEFFTQIYPVKCTIFARSIDPCLSVLILFAHHLHAHGIQMQLHIAVILYSTASDCINDVSKTKQVTVALAEYNL